MKIVIEIGEEVYKRIKNGCPDTNDCFECQDGVLYGTPIVNGQVISDLLQGWVYQETQFGTIHIIENKK